MFYSEMYKDVNMSFETLNENTGFKNMIYILEMLNLQRKLCRNFSKYFFKVKTELELFLCYSCQDESIGLPG